MLRLEQLPDSLHTKRLGRQDVLLVTLAVDVETAKDVKTVKTFARNAGCTEVQKWNVSQILKNSRGKAIRLKEGWCLSSNGRAHVDQLGVLSSGTSPKVIHHARELRAAVARIPDPETQSFVNEAIVAYEAGLYRSAVVLSWTGAISLLYDKVINVGLSSFNAEAIKKDAKWRPAKIKEDLTRMKESDFLDIIGSPPLSIIGKNLKEELKNNCLRLRNSCGHPNALQIGESRTSAHLEILILNVFARGKKQ
ncbi:MAG: hypothetical protein QME27_02625 [Syntrophaceae bacterium]|nr:hypothetical protein [Syntrophaceae bacterium]